MFKNEITTQIYICYISKIQFILFNECFARMNIKSRLKYCILKLIVFESNYWNVLIFHVHSCFHQIWSVCEKEGIFFFKENISSGRRNLTFCIWIPLQARYSGEISGVIAHKTLLTQKIPKMSSEKAQVDFKYWSEC